MFLIILVVVFFILAGFFSGIETGLISLDRLSLEQNAKKDKKKKKILKFLENPEKLFGTTLFGTNISIVIVTSISIYLLKKNDLEISEKIVTILIAVLILIFAEIIPKALFRDYPNKLVSKCFPLLNFFGIIFT